MDNPLILLTLRGNLLGCWSQEIAKLLPRLCIYMTCAILFILWMKFSYEAISFLKQNSYFPLKYVSRPLHKNNIKNIS